MGRAGGIVEKELNIIYETQESRPEPGVDIGIGSLNDFGSFYASDDSSYSVSTLIFCPVKRKGPHGMSRLLALC